VNREVVVEYNPELIRFAVWKFWTRSIGLSGFIAFGSVLAFFSYLLAIGDRSWLLGFVGALAGVALGIGILSYRIYLNRSMSKFDNMQRPTAKFQFTDDLFCIESDIGRSELSWKMIEGVWSYPSVWLVFIKKQGYVTLPVRDIDEEIKQFIIDKIEANNDAAI
jgi:hypothetical protein